MQWNNYLLHQVQCWMVVLFACTTCRAQYCFERMSSYTASGAIPDFVPKEQDCPSPQDPYLPQPHVPWYVPDRAYQTLPPEIELKNSSIPKAGLGVFARTFISQYTWLGEYEGEYIHVYRKGSYYVFLVSRGAHYEVLLDGYDVRTSNWLRWINCSRNDYEENVDVKYCAGKVYFITKKDIYPGQEILYYYGDNYAAILGIYYKA